MAENEQSHITDSTVAHLNDEVVSGDPADLAVGNDVKGPDEEYWANRTEADQERENAAYLAAREAELEAQAEGKVLVKGPDPAEHSDEAKVARGAEDRPDLTDYSGRQEEYFEIQPQIDPVVPDDADMQTLTSADVATVASVLGEEQPPADGT